MIASGPNPAEQLVIRRMFLEEGRTLDEVKAAFRHIEPAAIEAWQRSLAPPAPAAELPPAPADEPLPAAPEPAEELPRSRRRRG